MCIQATVNSSTTVYQLTAAGSTTPGYMALGFGTEMSDAPMVIVWKDTAGGVVLSQRTAPGHVQPKPDTAPARVAILDAAQTSALASQPVYTFTVPTSGDAANQKLIWAAASASPDDSSSNATIKFHDLGFGSFILDASSSLAQNGTPADTNASKQLPLASWEKMVIAHAVFFVIGFLVLLPIGALVARLLRTSVPWWFKVHWAVQFYITLPFMVIAFALGVAAVESHGGEHFNDFHKRTGLALFILYFAQCALGAIIHFIKSPNRRRRPGQNYIHAILGLTIIGLAIAQIRSGYAVEWDKATRRGKVGNAVNVLWVVWVVALPLLYIGGLFLLPRQWRQEREAREMREKRGMTDSRKSTCPSV
ncbi:CBD9-like protein [Exidia glandulosa HHB12029]|uniref:CBD9-like protein n=1 Tax=Exidia glandulosa HHB12029 TaxID=1314781 RepID=A0A165PAG5_EXIGL|nr:CBD9-like protein [Exidia glandulosa HHB12029]